MWPPRNADLAIRPVFLALSRLASRVLRATSGPRRRMADDRRSLGGAMLRNLIETERLKRRAIQLLLMQRVHEVYAC